MKIELSEQDKKELLEILGQASTGVSEFEGVHTTSEQAEEKQKIIDRWTQKIRGEKGQWFIAIHLIEDCAEVVTAEAIKQSLTEMLAGADIGDWQITNIEKLPK